ncbi:hypothetical protein RI367_006607 [Sorochytrium milnesiophthora]
MTDSIAAIPVLNRKGQMTVERVAIARYRPGKAPKDYRSDSSSDEEEAPTVHDRTSQGQRHTTAVRSRAEDVTTEAQVISDVQITHADIESDPRLRRLQRAAVERGDENGVSLRGRRRRHEEEEEDEEEEAATDTNARTQRATDDDAVQSRDMLKQRALRQAREAEEALGMAQQQREKRLLDEQMGHGSEDDEEATGSSEEETDSEDDIVSSRTLAKPKFIPKHLRSTIEEKERLEKEAEEAEQRRLQEHEARKTETRQMVVDEIKRDLKSNATPNGAADDVDDTDNIDTAAELAAWQQRELARIKRDRGERRRREKENAELERRRNMSDAERAAEDARVAKEREEARKNKPSMRFMQKYYHKGAFFQDNDEELYKRAYNEATLEDHFNKAALPEIMQVKNFGKIGQTKWTHLSKEDTSAKDALWNQNKELQRKMEKRRGGVGDLDKPTGRRR